MSRCGNQRAGFRIATLWVAVLALCVGAAPARSALSVMHGATATAEWSHSLFAIAPSSPATEAMVSDLLALIERSGARDFVPSERRTPGQPVSAAVQNRPGGTPARMVRGMVQEGGTGDPVASPSAPALPEPATPTTRPTWDEVAEANEAPVRRPAAEATDSSGRGPSAAAAEAFAGRAPREAAGAHARPLSGEAPAEQADGAMVLLSGLAEAREVELAGQSDVVEDLPRFPRADMAESMRRALEISHELGAARARVRSAEAMVDVARGSLRPMLDLRLSHGREQARPGSELDPVSAEPVIESLHNRGDSTAILRQSLIDFPAMAEVDRQRALMMSSELAKRDTGNEVMAETANAHLDLLRFRLAVKFASEHRESLEGLLEYVTERVRAGGASEAEAERVRARAINASANVIEANGALESAMVSYRRLVGAVPLRLATDDVLGAQPLPEPEDAVRQAIETSPAIQSRRENLRSIEQEARAAGAASMPKVHFEIGNYRTTNAGGRPGTSNDTRALFVMSLNVLNGGIDGARQRSALARVEEARFRILDAEQRLQESLTVSYNTLGAVDKRYQAVRQEYEANLNVVEAFRDQLEAARRPLLDVLDAQERLFASRLEMLRLIVLKASVELQIRRLMGMLSPTDLPATGSGG